MSKMGRKPINISGVQVEVKGHEVRYKGPQASGVYVLPELLEAKVAGDVLSLVGKKDEEMSSKAKRDVNRQWGLHRALLANALHGAAKVFEKKVQINGLGYKATQSGKSLALTLGFSHKIDFPLPEGISVDIDKTGQNLTFKSYDKELVGSVCSHLRAVRPPEPYKGTGVKYVDEVIHRKAGKTKAS